MDFKEVQNFIKFVTKSGASEVSLETEDYKITVKTGGDQTTVYAAPPVAAPEDKLIAPVVDSDEVPVAIVI